MKDVIVNVLLYPVAMTALAAGWCVLLSLPVRLLQRLDGFRPAPCSPVLKRWSARV